MKNYLTTKFSKTSIGTEADRITKNKIR